MQVPRVAGGACKKKSETGESLSDVKKKDREAGMLISPYLLYKNGQVITLHHRFYFDTIQRTVTVHLHPL